MKHLRHLSLITLAGSFVMACGDDALSGARDVGDTLATDTAASPDTTTSDAPADGDAPETVTDTSDTSPADANDTSPTDSLVDTADTSEATPDDTSVDAPDTSLIDTTAAPTCPPSACLAAPPDLGATSAWRHPVATGFTTLQGAARHRGRDLYLRTSDAQWALAKFAYGPFDDDLVDEDVDVYLLRDCAAAPANPAWEHLGTATTTQDGDHTTVYGIEDSGGWVYFPIPAARALGLGRHRLRFVVRGDHSVAEQFIEVLPPSPHFVVSDVDGTQTETETAEFTAVFFGTDPAAQPHGAESLAAFAARGYRIFYLTARPEWLAGRTHEWLDAHGYPPGLVHTTMTFTGSFGGSAETFKTDELTDLVQRFPDSVFIGIGNTASDEAAYHNIGLPSPRAFLYQFTPSSSGTRIDDYANLLPVAGAAPNYCE